MARWIYPFSEGDGSDKALLGGKGAGLAEMTRLGLPVPAGFTITTEACVRFLQGEQRWPDGLQAQLDDAVKGLEASSGRTFGDPAGPLLVSVRSGAAVSMPGMMDTVLNLGLNRETTQALAQQTGNAWFAWDTYRRFVQMFGDVVLGIHYTRFHRVQERYLDGRSLDDTSAEDLQALCALLEAEVAEAGEAFPSEPREQLQRAIDAVFRSYNSHRARYYRKTHGISDDAGTAVNVQQMVFGNMGADSGTGVAFTRNPKSGDRGLFGEWLPNAQGEDVVAGTRTPQPLNGPSTDAGETLQVAQPEVYAALLELQAGLEAHYRDMQDIEFTVESGTLYVLQTRTGKRTAQ
nr:pyruvate, phosphate dikinase [Myxococcales bacterium]